MAHGKEGFSLPSMMLSWRSPPIFQRLVEKHGVRYISYYGDGDSKSYEEVKNVYPGITVEKYECM